VIRKYDAEKGNLTFDEVKMLLINEEARLTEISDRINEGAAKANLTKNDKKAGNGKFQNSHQRRKKSKVKFICKRCGKANHKLHNCESSSHICYNCKELTDDPNHIGPHAINKPFMVKIVQRLEQLRDEVDMDAEDAEDAEVKEVMEDVESVVAEVGAIVVAMVEIAGMEGTDTAVQNSMVKIKVMRTQTPGPKIITSMVNHCTKR